MKLELNSDLFEYDIRGLLMAFFPWTKFDTDEQGEDDLCLSVFYVQPGNPACVDFKAVESGFLAAEISFTNGEKAYHRSVALDMADKKKAKTALKRALYGVLSEDAGHGLPWGTLTGIRPTKIAMGMLKEGASDEAVLQHMMGNLLVSDEKARLALEIAKREKPILAIAEEVGWSLYVGIPFCPSTCLYCSFSSFTIGAYRKKVAAYLEALSKELRAMAEEFQGRPLHSVYFGGGTPTSLEPEDLETLLKLVTELFDLSKVREFTVEAGRPDSITRRKLEVLKRYPVTRISINP